MEHVVVIILWVAAGIVASAINVWLLHGTTNAILKSRVSAVIISISFLLRMVICAVIFGISAFGGHFDRFAGCAGGFLLARMVLVKKIATAYAIEKAVK